MFRAHLEHIGYYKRFQRGLQAPFFLMKIYILINKLKISLGKMKKIIKASDRAADIAFTNRTLTRMAN